MKIFKTVKCTYPLISVLLLLLWVSCSQQLLFSSKTESQKEAESLFKWFRNNPPGSNASGVGLRREKSATLDRQGWELDSETWKAYRASWSENPVEAANMEKNHPILYYLRHTSNQAIKEIKNTNINDGAVIWKFYNMGYVIKTKDACIGIDLVSPGLTELTDILDLTIVSHTHHDHKDIPFLEAMTAAGKPVYSPFYSNGIVINSTEEINFGEVNIRFTMNDQRGTPVIVSQIDCGKSADNFTMYHIADSRILEELNPTRRINLLVLHISNSISIFDVIERIKPEATAFDHVMELGHPVGKYRWSYDYTYNKIKKLPAPSSYVLTWGEQLKIVPVQQ